MYFITPLEPTAFLLCTKQCRGEIQVHTVYGDVLNLSSEFCRLLFAVAAANGGLEGAQVFCEAASDYEILKAFLTDQPTETESGGTAWKTEKSKTD